MRPDSTGQTANLETGRRRRGFVPGLLAGGFALLLLAWVFASAPFTAPDEASHYLRALSITNGHLLGRKIPYTGVQLLPNQRAFVDHDSRAVDVPAHLAPPDVLCVDGRPDVRGCIESTATGDYAPTAYVLPALGLAVADSPTTGLWLSRLADALPCALLLALSASLLWGGGGLSLLGLLGALTPMVLFVCSVVNPSGLETAASLAFAAACLRLTRGVEPGPRWVWAALALSGALAILAWQAGPAFVALDAVPALALLQWRRLGGAVSLRGRRVMLTAGTLLTAVALWLVYSRVSGVGHTEFGIQPIRASLRAGLAQLGRVLTDAVGNFGSLTIHLPAGARSLWWLFAIGLVLGALWLGTGRQRAVVAATTLTALAFPVLAYAWVYRHSGFGMQGRQVLAALMLIPLVSGEVIWRQRGRLTRRALADRVPAGLGTVLALLQLHAFWFNARANAAPSGAIRFFSAGAWSPPLGWTPWLLTAVLGAGAIAAATIAGSRRRI